MQSKKLVTSALRIIVAVILLQTLYFKFTAHPDSVHIFSALGVEPWGRITLGIIELIVAVMILLPKTKTLGMLCSLIIILGAVASHLLVLGINVSSDNGKLFALALVVLFCSSIYLIWCKNEVISVFRSAK
ncbi:DoxX family protein [Nubsella zeaxanthinifaciens]|uniref:DoxX family protein n=1 Tax=Nubsella zeaxanthinifaciens TaxID=392412 RepID=UPI000DE43932|nr:DoxX family protein [Nubsella zeaxanthinifaciens]